MPSSASTSPAPSPSKPSDHPKSGTDEPDGHSTAAGAGRPPHQLQRAVTLATELQKLLHSLPASLKGQFHEFVGPLEALLDKLQQFTQG
ncbi:MAG: hypothetical protein ACYC3I_16555 [Gemmataceae bacterium]